MGWNMGYTIFEETVIGAYDIGKLDKALLAVLMEPYRNTDIDNGGCHDLKSKDGKCVEEIVIETWGLEVPKPPAGRYSDNRAAWDAYADDFTAKFDEVTDYFGWGQW